MTSAQSTLLVFLSAIVIFYDICARRIPNWALAAGLILNTTLILTQSDDIALQLFASITSLIVGLSAFLPFYISRWMGAGDVKLIGTLGFIVTLKPLTLIWLASCLTLATHCLATYLLKLLFRSQINLAASIYPALKITNFKQMFIHWRQGREGFPYGAHLGFCTIGYVISGGFSAI